MKYSSPEADNKDKSNLPIGLAILFIIQILFFFTVQIDNARYRTEAINYYFDSELNRIEFPLYVNFLQKYMANDIFYKDLEGINSGNMSNIELYWLAKFNPFFQSELEVASMHDTALYYVEWQKKRREYKQLVQRDIIHNYSFNTVKPTVIGVLVSAFSSENYTVFFVNLFFLIISGFLLEAKIGISWIIMGYLIGTLLMLSGYCVVAPYSLIPISAANGGVAGLLGILTTFYGAKKEKIYYDKGENMTSVYVAGFVFLPFWMVIQYFIYNFGMISSINVVTQVFSIVGGGLIGIFLKNKIEKNVSEKYHGGKIYIKEGIDLAAKEMADLNYDGAKKILYRVLKDYPNSVEILYEIFKLVASDPSSDEFHDIVKRIFSANDNSPTATSIINLVFNNYLRRAKPSIRVDVEILFELMKKFRKAGYFSDSEKILNVLMQKNENGSLSENLAREQLLLAKSYFTKGDVEQSDRLVNALIKDFPETEAGNQAKEMLKENKNLLS